MTFSGKINALAMARRSKPNMIVMVPDDGYVMVGADLVAAEPTIQCNLTNDETLRYQIFDGRGVKPYYREDGLLMIDDPYLAFASISPIGGDRIKELFLTGDFDGISFQDAWLKDPNIVKEHKDIGSIRKFSKGCALGLSYGLKGHTKKAGDTEHGLKNLLAKKGTIIPEEQAWELYERYWSMYPSIMQYKTTLETMCRKKQIIRNILGFRVNSKPKDAFNGVIQSSTSSIVSLAEYRLEARVDRGAYQHMLTIHDELVFQSPIDKAEEVCENLIKVGDEITEQLGWRYPIKFDPKIGKNMYEIK